ASRPAEARQRRGGMGLALLRRLAVRDDGGVDVAGHAEAVLVALPEVEQRVGIALLRGAAEPLDGEGVILRHAIALEVAEAEIELCVFEALVCRTAVP